MAAREAKAARAVVTPGRVAGGGMVVFDGFVGFVSMGW
jgi:hypothetical protein